MKGPFHPDRIHERVEALARSMARTMTDPDYEDCGHGREYLRHGLCTHPDHDVARPTIDPATVRSPRFRQAVREVFEAPGEWGPAQGYYAADIDHFIEMLAERLSDG